MFRKELKELLEGPIRLVEHLDRFLGPNIYTREEMQSIMTMLFTLEERQVIWAPEMQIWEREHMQRPPRDLKMPTVRPNWDHNNPGGRQNMAEYKTLIARGIKLLHEARMLVGYLMNSRKKEEIQQSSWKD